MNHFNSFRVLNRSMRDVAWFDFFNILAFKAAEAGKQVIVDEFIEEYPE